MLYDNISTFSMMSDKRTVLLNLFSVTINKTIENINDTKYLVKGVYELVDDNTVHITELPVGTWTDDYKQFLEGLLEGGGSDKGKKITPVIKDYRDMSKTTNIDIIVQFSDSSKLYKLMSTYGENGINGLEKLLRLTTTISTTNMHLFDSNEKLKKYSKVEEIIDDYYDVRLEGYVKRKKHIIKILEGELIVLHNKARYIKEVLEDTLDIRRKKRDVIVNMLETKKYDKIEGDEDYKYLLKMTMDSVSDENVSKINSDHVSKKMELEHIKKTRPEDMWLHELDELLIEYGKHITERKQQSDMNDKKSKKTIKKGK